MKFNDKIKKLRIDNNLTQQELADKLFVSRSAVAKWEQGRGLPSLDLIEKISQIFGVKIEYLLDEREMCLKTIENSAQIKKQRRINIIMIAIIIITILIGIFVLPEIVMHILHNKSHCVEMNFIEHICTENIFISNISLIN